MFKVLLIFIFGLLIGGGAGFWGGSQYTEEIAQKAMQEKTMVWEKDLSSCKDERYKIDADYRRVEAELKLAQDDLKLNQAKEGFITTATLLPPQFDPPNLDTITSNSKGEVLLKWAPVKGAKRYNVVVQDKEGKTIHTSEVDGETYLYINIATKSPEGDDYFARISSVNGLDQPSQLSEPKPLHFNPRKPVATNTVPSTPIKKANTTPTSVAQKPNSNQNSNRKPSSIPKSQLSQKLPKKIPKK